MSLVVGLVVGQEGGGGEVIVVRRTVLAAVKVIRVRIKVRVKT
jgi:hypothetical protein